MRKQLDAARMPPPVTGNGIIMSPVRPDVAMHGADGQTPPKTTHSAHLTY